MTEKLFKMSVDSEMLVLVREPWGGFTSWMMGKVSAVAVFLSEVFFLIASLDSDSLLVLVNKTHFPP